MPSAENASSSTTAGSDVETAELLKELLRRTHLSAPSDIGATVRDQAASLGGATDVGLYLVNYEQDTLVPIPGGVAGDPESLSVTGTVAGRAYTSAKILKTPGDAPGRQRLWVPLLDGTERLGTIGLTFPEAALSDALIEACERYAHLVAMFIVTKGAYGDAFEMTRRRKTMTIASELVGGWRRR